LKLADTIIVDSAFPPNEIPHAADDGWVTVTWLGDLDIDFDVDYLDDRIFGRAYIAYGQTGEYDPRCDFNDDGKIDYLDDRIFGKAYVEYGQTLY
jgi:hypothetical protein